MHRHLPPQRHQDFYPRSPCGERPPKSEIFGTPSKISIHALLAESDGMGLEGLQLHMDISIHALLAESDAVGTFVTAYDAIFLSTLSLRRATITLRLTPLHFANFYPRSPCGERLMQIIHSGLHSNFYPRSPCGERLHNRWVNLFRFQNFYPRSPCGERPRKGQSSRAGIGISIHALLAESDMIHPLLCNAKPNFYPRSPCGERRIG